MKNIQIKLFVFSFCLTDLKANMNFTFIPMHTAFFQKHFHFIPLMGLVWGYL